MGAGDEGAVAAGPREDDVARLVADQQRACDTRERDVGRVDLDDAHAVRQEVRDPRVGPAGAVGARGDRHGLEADCHLGGEREAAGGDRVDLQAVVGRVDGEQPLRGGGEGERPDVAALEVEERVPARDPGAADHEKQGKPRDAGKRSPHGSRPLSSLPRAHNRKSLTHGGLAMTRPVALGTAPHAPARARPGRHPGRPGGLAPDPYAGDAGPDDLRAQAAEGRLLQRHPALRGVLSRRRPAMRRTPRRTLPAGRVPRLPRVRPGRAGTGHSMSTPARLGEHRYAQRHVALCWGDARLPNLIYRNDEVVGVLDWEMAFLGDPEADLGWWLFMHWATGEGYGFPPLEGFPGREETIRRYEALTGRPVEHAFYNEVLAALRFGAIMARIAGRMADLGIPAPMPDFETNTQCHQRLAALLELPPPGRS